MPSISVWACDNYEHCKGYTSTRHFGEYHLSWFSHCERCFAGYRRVFIERLPMAREPEIPSGRNTKEKNIPRVQSVPELDWFLDPEKGEP
jgi:hypothetical protein